MTLSNTYIMNNILNFNSFIKFLSRNKAYTAIDIFGLSISLMFVILIAVYTIQELSTDRYQTKADRIYVVGNDTDMGSAYRLAYRIQERFPEVNKVCPMSPFKGATVFNGDNKYSADLLLADLTFFDFFSFDLLNVSREQALSAKNHAVISESFARKAFPDTDPMGKSLRLNDSVSVTVNGIMKDIKNSTIPYADVLLRMDNVKFFNYSLDDEGFSNAGGSVVFLMAKENADLQSKTDDMRTFFKEIFWIYQRGIWDQVTLTPLKQIYFSDLKSSMLNQGDRKFVMILMSVGMLILLFAVINYINLTVAQTGFRAKEMATRMLLGSSRGELFVRLILESTLICFVSFLIAMFFALTWAPYASTLLATKLVLADALTPQTVLITLSVIILLGLISGLLPAFVISNAKPIEVVRGSFRKKTKMVFSKFFITFQNIITIALIAASITMVMQVNHLINAPLGYNTTNVIDINALVMDSREQAETFINEVSQLACVERVGMTQGTPFARRMNWSAQYEGNNISFQVLTCDSVCFNILGIQKLRDNHVTTDRVWYLSEQSMKEMGLSEDATSFKLDDQDKAMTIGGIVKDFQTGNITNGIAPIILEMKKRAEIYPVSILVEVAGNPYTAMEEVNAVYKRITNLEFGGKFIDQKVADSFEGQQRISRIVTLFAGIAILISLLGLLAMSTYFIQQRSTEVAIRKVFGSSNSQILIRLIRTFLLYVVVAFVLVTPFIRHFLKQWLSDYSYRIELSPLIFIASGIFCLLVSFIAVFIQSYRAANANPVNSIANK